MTDTHASARAICAVLDWDWSDDAQRETCIEAANAAVLAEREECAAIAIGRAEIQRIRARAEGNDYAAERAIEADAIADAIRARGQT